MNTSEPIESNSPAISPATPYIKFREGCILNNLSATEREQLFDWLELHSPKTVLEMVAAPPPDGFGIKTHLNSLRRFHHRARNVFHKELSATPGTQFQMRRNLPDAPAQLRADRSQRRFRIHELRNPCSFQRPGRTHRQTLRSRASHK
jgi:hypothetical protein